MTDEGRDQLQEGRVSGSAETFQKESRLMQGQSPRVNPDRVVPEVKDLPHHKCPTCGEDLELVRGADGDDLMCKNSHFWTPSYIEERQERMNAGLFKDSLNRFWVKCSYCKKLIPNWGSPNSGGNDQGLKCWHWFSIETPESKGAVK